MAEWIRDKKITRYVSVPTVFRFFLKTSKDDLDLSTIRLVHLGGEAVRTDDIELYKQYFPDTSILMANIGSSEAGGISRHYFDKNSVVANGEVPLGKPYPHKEIQIWDTDENEVPQGVIGELVVKTEFLARGYRNNPELTDKVFRKVPGHPKVRIYKTGDLARFREDGCLVFIGRKDQQIKINGHRIEIGEIEAALSSQPHVKVCAIKAWPDPERGVKLVAYIEAFEGQILLESDLRAALEAQLSYFKIPRTFVFLDRLPLLSSGKLDRNSLPQSLNNNTSQHEPQPLKDAEKRLRQIWLEALNLEDAGCDDNFFAHGGDSLQAIRLINHIEAETGKKLPLNSLFKHPTIRKLAKYFEDEHPKTSNLVPLKSGGKKPPLFIVHGWAGSIFHWVDIASMLELERPLYGIQGNEFSGKGKRHSSVEALADDYAEQIIQTSPEGPYHLAGYSLGGVFAFAVAKANSYHLKSKFLSLTRCCRMALMPFLTC
jgi:acyl carrier protein